MEYGSDGFSRIIGFMSIRVIRVISKSDSDFVKSPAGANTFLYYELGLFESNKFLKYGKVLY